MKKRIVKNITSVALTAFMAFSLVFTGMGSELKAHAAEYEKNVVGIGTSIIKNPSEGFSYVYYGKYDGISSTRYRVLDNSTRDFSELTDKETMLLDCDTVLYKSQFHISSCKWSSSYVRSGLNGDKFLTKEGNFTAGESEAIVESTKTKVAEDDNTKYSSRFQSINGDKVFVLCLSELYSEKYGHTGEKPRYHLKEDDYYVRTIAGEKVGDKECSTCVRKTGGQICIAVNELSGVSPSFNIDKSSVLFTSLVSGTAGEIGAEYKLTMFDKDLSVNVNEDVTNQDGTLSIPYEISGDASQDATNVSVIVTDKAYTESDVSVKAYSTFAVSDNSGSISFKLPEDLGEDWKFYIVAEEVNGEKETDYSSEPVEITFPKADQEVEAPAPVSDLEYNGEAQTLINPANVINGNKSEGSVLYSLDKEEWSEELPKATDAGKYEVYYKVKENIGFNEYMCEEPVVVNIAPKKPVDPTPVDPTPVDPAPVTPTPGEDVKPSVGDTFTVSGMKYKIISADTVSLIQAKNAKTVTVPATVKNSGKTFKVVRIGANAFKKSKATKVVIKTKNLKKQAVKNCLKGSKVKSLKIKVGKKKVNKTYLKKYKKIFTKKIAGKKVIISL